MSRKIVLLLIGLTLLVYGKSIRYDYISVDDGLLVVANPLLQPVSAGHLKQIWTAPYCDVFMPVTLTVWSAVALVAHVPTPDQYGAFLNPYWFHLLNVALHVAAVLLVWRILIALGFAPWPAAAGAALFAVHPLQVEAVAWISSGKDLIGGTLALAAMLLLLRFARRGSWLNYVAATLLFILAMLSKATASVTPLVLLPMLMIVPGVNRRRSMLSLLPWLALVLPMAIVTHHTQARAILFFWSAPWFRPFEAIDALAFYLWKLLCPVNLAIDYSRTPTWVLEHRREWVWWLLPVAVATIVIVRRRQWPRANAGLAVFAIALLPVLGLAPFIYQTYSTVADRYMYIPMLGIAMVMAAVASRVQLRRGGVVVISTIAILTVIAFVQTGVWASSDILFQHAVDVCPVSGFGWSGVAVTRSEHDDWPGAIDALHRTLRVRPRDYITLSALAQAYLHQRDRRGYDLTQAWMNYESLRLIALTQPESAAAQRRWKAIESHPPTTRP